MNFKDPKIQITVILAALSLALLGLFYKFSYQASSQRIAQLRTDESKLRQELDQVRAAVSGLQELEKQYIILEKKWSQAQKLLPTDKEIPSLLKQITNAGIEAQVRFLIFKPGNLTNATALSQAIPVNIQVIGAYHQIAMFLNNMGNLPRIVISSNVKLTPNAGDPDRIIKAELVATAYVFKSGGVQSAQPTTSRRVQ
ncbi:MAG: type 4a pilus biogenesis protein PilO [Candidatus Edwardsbacteria bacterium]|nr:type 4a pilus biogenesis protein PilO [Candidatus Edwardsbacteria bacterium]